MAGPTAGCPLHLARWPHLLSQCGASWLAPPLAQGVELLVYLEGWSDQHGRPQQSQLQQPEVDAQQALVAATATPATSPQAGPAADPYRSDFSALPAAGFQQTGELAAGLPGHAGKVMG